MGGCVVRRRVRVRVHLVGVEQSLEGVLVARRRDHLELAVPRVLVSEDATVALDEARSVVVLRDRVAFYEVLR